MKISALIAVLGPYILKGVLGVRTAATVGVKHAYVEIYAGEEMFRERGPCEYNDKEF